jgi:aminodeoxyfutalosine synthase
MPIRDTLEILREAGLGSITGGGAEIFDPIVRDQICRGKETAAEWLDVHRTWHSMGGRSTCTMLYGHIETLAHRADHLRQLRQLQDETGGFTGLFLLRSSRRNPTEFLPTSSAPPHLSNCAISR